MPCIRRRHIDHRVQRDEVLIGQIDGVWQRALRCAAYANCGVHCSQIQAARCTVDRLMRQLGILGVVCGKAVKTVRPDTAQPCPRELVN